MKRSGREHADAGELPWPRSRHGAAVWLLRRAVAEAEDQARRWQRKPDDETLHDWRIGLRRLRALLRVFRDEVEALGGRELRADLTAVADKLGAARDGDIVVELLATSQVVRSGRYDDEVVAVRGVLEGQHALRQRSVQRMMEGDAWPHLMARANALVEALARGPAYRPRQRMERFVERQVERHHRRVSGLIASAESTQSDVLHAFRVTLRRWRYAGDLLGPWMDKDERRLIKRIRVAERKLGLVHDVDVALAWWSAHPRLHLPVLVQEWRQLRERRRGQFLKKWAKCRKRLAT